MKNTIWLALPFFLLLGSCEYSDIFCVEPSSPCSVENPVEDLAWLRDEIQEREQQVQNEYTQYQYIAQAEYEGETVFVYGNCCPNCLTVTLVFNCAGEQIGLLGYREGDIDYSIREQAVVVWKSAGYSCTL